MKKFKKKMSISLLISLVITLFVPVMVFANESSVNLETANSFAVLAGSTITNTGPTTIAGDIGLHPGTSFTGQETLTQSSGAIYINDAVALQAKNDLQAAYTDAAGRISTTIGSELGGSTLTPGVYRSATSFQITGTLVLDGQNNSDAVFIFQAATTLTTAENSNIQLINGANAKNVFWQVGSSATLGLTSSFAGTILASESITATTGGEIDGQLLAISGAVTLDSNTITTYTPGSLTVEKTVSGDIGDMTLPVFSITVTGPNNFSSTRTFVNNETYTWGNLLPGTYNVTESRTGLSSEWTVSGEGAVTVVADETNLVTINNLYTATVEPLLGSLTVGKTVSGDIGDMTLPVFSITVTGPNDFSSTRTFVNNETFTWTNLVPGAYNVTESRTGLSSEWAVSGEGTVQVVANETNLITVNNLYTATVAPLFGSLTVGKTVSGNIGDMTLPVFTITVTGPNNFSSTRTFVNNETFTWANLVPGAYNVTESRTGLSSEWAVSGEGAIQVLANETHLVTINNLYTLAVDSTPVDDTPVESSFGSLTVEKTVTGDIGDMTLPVFTITVTGPNNFSATRTFLNNESYTWRNLLPGTYNVTENSAGLSSEWTVSGEGTLQVVANETHLATITNLYVTEAEPLFGGLTVGKTVTGNIGNMTLPVFRITVTGPNNFSSTRTFINNESYTWRNLSPGEYYVIENRAGLSNEWTVSGEGSVQITANETHLVTVNNLYVTEVEPLFGSLTVRKTVTGDIGNMTLPVFRITLTGPNNFSSTRTFINNESYTWGNLLPGEYNVTENRAGLSSEWRVSGEGAVQVTANQINTAILTNNYQREGALPNTGQKTNDSMAILFGGLMLLFVGAGMLLDNKKTN